MGNQIQRNGSAKESIKRTGFIWLKRIWKLYIIVAVAMFTLLFVSVISKTTNEYFFNALYGFVDVLKNLQNPPCTKEKSSNQLLY